VTYRFRGDLPSEWGAFDIGDVGATGSTEFDGSRYTVRGSGADIWGTADEFQFAHSVVSGDFEFTAYVPYVENVDRWTKAGLMIRDGLGADARHASLFATPRVERGVAFQRRPIAGGTSVHTAGPATAPPVWLRLTRQGDLVTAATSADGSTWTRVGEQRFTGLPDVVNVGLAVSSHVDGRLAEAWFEQVTLVSLDSHVPEGWMATDVGDVAARGRTSVDEDSGPEFAVYGSGADVWGTADEFHFASLAVTGDFVFSARVAHVENVDRWTKAGLMMRDGLAANARHAFLIQTPGTDRGVAYQRRTATGGATVHTAGPANAPGGFLLLVREGDMVSAFYRADVEANYILVGRQLFTGLPATVRVGFAVTSHADGTLARASFDNVAIVQPEVWESFDIGDVSAEGRSYIDGPSGHHGVTGSGADVWGTADEFHFLSREVTGDFTFIAQARHVENVDPWTKAGLMLRDGMAADARHAFAIDTGSSQRGLAFQRRPTAGGATLHTAGPTDWPHEEVWLRLVRQGNVVSAYYKGHSTSTWTLLGTQTFAGLPATLRVGLAVTSHADGTLATAVFDNVALIQ
jgi:regulation of enolase protein 1 (concanavalin A-like superfamily)